MLDPFLPERPDDVERLKAIQREIHEMFIGLVKSRRGAKLTGPENALFSGEYWTGQTALSYGIVDGLGDVRQTLRARFGEKVAMPLIAAERGLFGRRLRGISAMLGGDGSFAGEGSLADDVVSALEARALWGRYGI